MLPSDSFHCLLCRGIVSSSDKNLRYKDHLKREHKVYFYTNWIVEKTITEETNVSTENEEETLMNGEEMLMKGKLQSLTVTKIKSVPKIKTEKKKQRQPKIKQSVGSILNSTPVALKFSVKVEKQEVQQDDKKEEFKDFQVEEGNESEISSQNDSDYPDLGSIINAMDNNEEPSFHSSMETTDIDVSTDFYDSNDMSFGVDTIESENDSSNDGINTSYDENTDEQLLNEEAANKSNILIKKPSLLIKRTTDGKQVYSCSFCPERTFSNRRKGRQHVIKAKFHDQNEEESQQSNTSTKNPSLIIKRTTDGKKSYKCSSCPVRTFTSKWKAKHHVKKAKFHDGQLIIQEESQQSKIITKQPSLVIKRTTDGKKTYSCSFCPERTYPSKWKGKHHVINAKYHDQNSTLEPNKPTILITRGPDGKRRIGCSACPKVYKTRKQASSHVLNPDKHKNITKDQTGLIEEGSNARMVKIVDSRIVKKELVFKSNLDPFVIVEPQKSGEKIYRCSMCPQKTYNRKQHASRHLERHRPIEERKHFTCTQCTKKFVCKQTFVKHESLCQGLQL